MRARRSPDAASKFRAKLRWVVPSVVVATSLMISGCSTDKAGGGSTASSSAGGTGQGGQDKGAHGTVDALTLSSDDLAKAKSAGAGKTIGIVAPLSAEYLSNVVAGAKDVASQLGMKTTVVDYQFDATKGIAGIENLVSQGVKYMVVVLTDPTAMIGAVKAAEGQGVTVVQFAGAQVADQAGGFSVSIDDADLGTVLGDTAAAIAKTRGAVQIAILDFPSQPNVIIRADNAEKQIKANAPNAKIVARIPGGTQDIGLRASESLLQKYPNLGGIVSINDAGAYGAVQAFEGAHKTPANAFVIGCDAESKARQLIGQHGIFKASVDTQPKLTGQAAVEVIGNLLAGKKVAQYTKVPVKAVTG